MNLRSGISRELETYFIVDENALIRIKSALDKAAESLEITTQVIFRVEREDDRFYETTDLKEVISDPNIPGKKITQVKIELREIATDETSVIRRLFLDWFARISFNAKTKYLFHPSQIDFEVDTKVSNKSWALLLADDLEPQINRTINHSKIPRWPLFGIGIYILYILSYGFTYLATFIKGNLSSTHTSITPLIGVSIVTSVLGMAIAIYFVVDIIIGRNEANWIKKLMGPESVFLWGEEERQFREREERRKNIFWVVVVGFIVSIAASIAFEFFGKA